MPRTAVTPRWMSRVLLLAGLYNLTWGFAVLLFPVTTYEWGGLAGPDRPLVNVPLWQCIGMIVGVYGVGYAIASRDPLRHWPIVLVGFLGKVLGPIGFVWYAARGELPWTTGVTNLFNDLIWWLPFALILWRVYSDFVSEPHESIDDPETIIARLKTHQGESLARMSEKSPILVVFLRHSGCTFCRQTLANVAANRAMIEAAGRRIALVHLSPDDQSMAALVQRYSLDDLPRISDPAGELYRAVGLKRARLGEWLFSGRMYRHALAGLWAGHGYGLPDGDGLRKGGAMLVRAGKVTTVWRAADVADQPDLAALACGRGSGG